MITTEIISDVRGTCYSDARGAVYTYEFVTHRETDMAHGGSRMVVNIWLDGRRLDLEHWTGDERAAVHAWKVGMKKEKTL